MPEQEALELAEIYALNAITEQERRELLEAVHGMSPEVQGRFEARVTAAREAAALLSADVHEEPPQALRLAVLDIPRQHGRGAGRPGPEVVDFSAEQQKRASRSRPASRRSPWLLAAAAAVLLVLGYGSGYFTGSRNVPVAQAVLEAPDMQMISGSSPEGGQLQLMVSQQRDAAVVVFKDMTMLPEGQAYQLWLIQDGQPVSAAVFNGGPASAAGVTTVRDINTTQTVAMTVEPRGGVPAPTGPVVISAAV